MKHNSHGERRRNNPGEIRDAIIAALDWATAPAAVREIREHVVLRLGREVPASSIRSYLQLNTPSTFTRVERGRYILGVRERQLEFEDDAELESVQVGMATMVKGDCFKWLSSAPASSVEAVVTDPPYGLVEYSRHQQAKLRTGKGGVWRIPPAYDGFQRSPLPRFTTLTSSELNDLHLFFLGWTRAVYRVLVPGAHVFVASNPLVSHIVADALSRGGLERRGEVIRLVMTMRGGDRPKNAHVEFPDVTVMPRSMWEPWLLFRKPLEGRVQDNLRRWKTGGLRRISNAQPFGDVIRSHPTSKKERGLAPHPSLKPQAFLRQLVRAALPLGEGTVLDPFAGAGSTAAAANAIGYSSVAVEKDPVYFATALRAVPELSKLRPG